MLEMECLTVDAVETDTITMCDPELSCPPDHPSSCGPEWACYPTD